MLNKSGESGHPCLIPDLRGSALSFSLLRLMLAVGLSYITFTLLSYGMFPLGFPDGSVVKNKQEMRVWSLSREDPLEKEMATHSSNLAWKIPWTEEPVRLQPMGSQKSWTWLKDQTTTINAPSMSTFQGVFTINRCWILSKAFSCMWYITLIDLQILENPCIPAIYPTCSCCMIF